MQAKMNARYPIEWVPATPEYVLACFQEEWRQRAWLEAAEPAAVERPWPTFETTIQAWREALDLVWWSPLGQSYNKSWGTRFSEWRWFSVLVPARQKTLRDVCHLLASQARRPRVPPAKLLGCACGSAGIFLAVRSLLSPAGAPPGVRPSTPVGPFLKRWPKVFLREISRLAPGGLPFTCEDGPLVTPIALGSLAGVLLLLASCAVAEPVLTIAGVILFGAGWLGGLCYRGRLAFERVRTFRGLTGVIVEQQRRAGVGPGTS
jgi:hypothetical protein